MDEERHKIRSTYRRRNQQGPIFEHKNSSALIGIRYAIAVGIGMLIGGMYVNYRHQTAPTLECPPAEDTGPETDFAQNRIAE